MTRSVSTSSALAAVEQKLRTPPPMAPAPARLHARVMAQIAAAKRPEAGIGRPVQLIRFALPAAACIAAAAAAALYFASLPVPAPVHPPIAQADRAAITSVVDPTPLILPAAQFLANSLDQHLADEAQSVLEDTRKAADFVVSCLPFTRGG
jgi:hypothetical protein